MSEPTELPHRTLDGDDQAARSATQLTILLRAAAATVDEEFRRSERLDTKSRNQLNVAAASFGLAQLITVGLVNGTLGAKHTHAAFIVAASAAGILALLAMAWASERSYRSWDLLDEKSLGIATFDLYLGPAQAGNPNVGANLVTAYAEIADVRRRNNVARGLAVEAAARACRLTLALVAFEIVVAFVAVIVQHA